MRQKRGFVVELNPADHAMVLQILGDLRFADSEMLGQFGLQAFGVAAPAARVLPPRLPPRARFPRPIRSVWQASM